MSPTGTAWPIATRDQAIGMYRAGHGPATIAETLRVPATTISHWVTVEGIARGDNPGLAAQAGWKRRIAEVGLSAPEVCRRVGLTYRQLDWWTRTGLVSASLPAGRSGQQRAYSADDVARIERIARLTKAGVDPAAIRRIGLERITRLLAEAVAS